MLQAVVLLPCCGPSLPSDSSDQQGQDGCFKLLALTAVCSKVLAHTSMCSEVLTYCREPISAHTHTHCHAPGRAAPACFGPPHFPLCCARMSTLPALFACLQATNWTPQSQFNQAKLGAAPPYQPPPLPAMPQVGVAHTRMLLCVLSAFWGWVGVGIGSPRRVPTVAALHQGCSPCGHMYANDCSSIMGRLPPCLIISWPPLVFPRLPGSACAAAGSTCGAAPTNAEAVLLAWVSCNAASRKALSSTLIPCCASEQTKSLSKSASFCRDMCSRQLRSVRMRVPMVPEARLLRLPASTAA